MKNRLVSSVGFYGMSNFRGYLTTNHVYTYFRYILFVCNILQGQLSSFRTAEIKIFDIKEVHGPIS